VIRSLGSKTYQVFNDAFAGVPFRYVATATPSPNEYRELIYYAEFLGIMDHGQCLTRWFKRNPDKAGDLQLNPLQEEEFWLWVATWALFLFTPSDLGYDDNGYALPKLNVHWHRIPVDQTRAWDQADNHGQGLLLLNPTLSATTVAHEKRATLDGRLLKALEILDSKPADTHWIIWHDLERERDALRRVLPDVRAVYGSQEQEAKEETIIGFSRGEIQSVALKPILSGSGHNFQYHCHHAVYLGVGYKFQDFIQSLHRVYRFQQKHEVEVHIIYAESEDKVRDTLVAKWERHTELQERFRAIVRRYGLSHVAIRDNLKRKLGVERVEQKGERYTIVHNDNVAELPRLADNSVDMICTSIPFSKHYEYSIQLEDFGHNPDDAAFFRQMDFLLPELLRVLKPGRIAAIHVKDLISYGHATESGFMEIDPFSDKTVAAFRAHGFMFGGRRQIDTDVVRENNSTYRLGYSEMCNDASKMGCGLPEYLLTFRKPPSDNATARADEPIVKSKSDYSVGRWQIDASAHWKSDGKTIAEPYDHEAHVKRLEDLEDKGNLPKTYFCEPPQSGTDWIWDNVQFMQSLNATQVRRGVESHLCPLPFDIVRRAIRLYSNPDDLVLDPFLGIGTTVYIAMKLGRRGYGIELSPSFYADAAFYCDAMDRQMSAPTLFDMTPQEDA